ncbi:MAG: SpoIIE family protein phosphatase [Oligoflexales bacterium]
MSETIQQLFEVILEVCGQTIFFIDDIQWLDHASSKLITKILRFSKKQTFFMVVATSRSDHDSLDALERFKKNNAKLIKKNINLEPLEKNQTKPIIIDFFGNQTVPVEIIDWIYNRSEGSPFAIHEYSKSVLYSENVSFSWGEWILLKNIEECKEISANLVNSIVSSFNSLSVNCKEILKISSVDFGFINADILSSVTKMSNKSISRYLSEAVEKGFIEYRKKDVLAFRHDKIMEACFSVVTDAEKLNYHNEILSYLIKHEESFDVYRIVNHIKFDFYKKEPNQCFQFIMKAGLSSMKDGSYEDAEKQFQFVLDHKELFDIENNFEFYYAAAIAVSRSTRNHEALSLSETALKISGSNQIARAELYEVRSKIYLVHINLEKSIENTILGFDALGMPYRDGAFSNFTSAIWTLITSYKKDYKHLYRERTDEEAYFDSIYIRLNASLFHTGFHLLRHDYLMHGQTRNLEFLKTRGSIKDLALMYGALSVTLAVLSLKKSSVKLVKKALAYANSVQDYSALSEIMHYSTLGYDMTGDPLQALQISLNNVSDMKRWLPPTNVLEGLSIRAQIFIARGAITEALNDYNSHLNEISELPEDGVTCLYFKSIKAVLLLMTGDVKGSAELMRNQEHMMEKLKASSFLLSHYLCEKMYLALFSGDVLENIDSLHNLWCKSLNFNPRTAIHQAKHYYIAHAHALFESCLLEKTKGGISDNSRKKMKEASYSLKICNGKSFFKTHSYYIQAGEYYLDGDFKKSRSMIEKARISAEEYSVFWIICACLRLESLILKETGYTEVANERMESANFLANKYQLNFLVDHEISTAHHVITQSHGSRSLLQSTSGDIRSKKYLDSLLNISIYCYQKKKIEDTIYYALFEVVSNLNAERAFLVLNKDDSSDVYGLNSEKENIVEEFSTADQIVIQDVHRNESPYVSDDVEYEIVGSHRIESNIRSIIAAPIIINDVKLGLLYLDSRIIKGVFNSSDIEIVSAMANHIGAAIESHKSAQVELERQEALKNLEITGVIQKLLLPLERELSNNGFDLLSYFLPASQSGGDWMWYHVAEDKTVIAIVGDVTDHGPGPAMITAVIAGCYQALMKTYSSPHHHMNEIIESFQRCIQGMGGGKYWMSMSIIAFNPDTMNLQAWSLGAPPVIVVREQSTVFLNAPSSPLGSDDFTVSESLSLQLDTDDTVLMFTDGIYEYPMKNGRHMTLGKLKKMISSQIEKKNVKNALEQLLGFIKENHADSPQEDDMTVVLLKVYKH